MFCRISQKIYPENFKRGTQKKKKKKRLRGKKWDTELDNIKQARLLYDSSVFICPLPLLLNFTGVYKYWWSYSHEGWFSRSEVGPEILHFLWALQGCQCNWSTAHTLNNKVFRNLQEEACSAAFPRLTNHKNIFFDILEIIPWSMFWEFKF